MERDRNTEVTRSLPDSEEPGRDPGPAWAARLKDLARLIASVPPGTGRRLACEEAWLILNAALAGALRRQSSRLGRVSREDLEGIAAQKSLDLLTKIEEAEWDPTGHTPVETAAYLSRVARNALVDWMRAEGRWVHPTTDDDEDHAVDWPDGTGLSSANNPPDEVLAGREFAQVLVGCVKNLQPRSRRIWFLRVFCDLSSREIAGHPEVNLKPSHVDVVLQRSRHSLRDCMQKHGYQLAEMPAGVFVAIWDSLQPLMVDFAVE